MKSRDLLSKLSVLESLLHDFSYEELNSKEAAHLKKSFDSFKKDLENLVYGQSDSKASLEEILNADVAQEKKSPKSKETFGENEPLAISEQTNLVNGLRILVFEDNLLSQRLIELQLAQLNCTSFVTDDVTAGLKILEDKFIDIVLMDLRMPIMSGFEVSALIRQSKNLQIAHVPIIAVSADISLLDREKIGATGINDFMRKPYAMDELVLKLKKNTNKGESTEELGNSPEIQAKPEKQKADISALLVDCMGDIGLLEELVNLFKQNSLEFIDKATTSITNSNYEDLKFAAHKIKNGVAMVKASGLQELVAQIYKGCESTLNWKVLKALCMQFSIEYDLVVKTLDSQIIEARK